MANKLMNATFLVDTEKLKEVGESFADALTWCEDSGLYLETYMELPPLDLSAVTCKKLDELEEEYCLCVGAGRYILDSDLEQLFQDSNITMKTLNKSSNWTLENGEVDGVEEGTLLETLLLEQNGKRYTCQVYAQDSGCCLDMALDLLHTRELGRTWVVQSVEEEIGEENHLLYVPKTVSEEEVKKALSMAARYAVEDMDFDIEEGKKLFDEYFQCLKTWKGASGQFRFNHYIKRCMGWHIEPLVPDFAYEW